MYIFDLRDKLRCLNALEKDKLILSKFFINLIR